MSVPEDENIQYTNYTVEGPANSQVQLKEAIIPITVSIAGTKSLTILRFKVLGKNNNINEELTSRTIAISCNNCGG